MLDPWGRVGGGERDHGRFLGGEGGGGADEWTTQF